MRINILMFVSFQSCGIYDGPYRITEGREFDVSNIDKIVKGETTKNETQKLFGTPYIKTDKEWTYYFSKTRTRIDRKWLGFRLSTKAVLSKS